MNLSSLEKIKELNLDDIIWYIYIFLAFSALYSNYLEKEYSKNHDLASYNQFHKINIYVQVIAFFIYIYFLNNALKNHNKKRSLGTTFSLIASILLIVTGTLLILAEFISANSDFDEVAI